MFSTKLIFGVAVCVSLVLSMNIPRPTSTGVPFPTPPTCGYNGKTYYAGQQFDPNPCSHCHCTLSGQVECIYGDCFGTPCVDSVRVANQCCPVCPNGHNCRHPDGTIIKVGVLYKPNNYSTCMCPDNTFGLRGNEAICTMRIPTPTPGQSVS